ncbi:hypothetical protein D3C86_1303500 [compost metagenome]
MTMATDLSMRSMASGCSGFCRRRSLRRARCAAKAARLPSFRKPGSKAGKSSAPMPMSPMCACAMLRSARRRPNWSGSANICRAPRAPWRRGWCWSSRARSSCPTRRWRACSTCRRISWKRAATGRVSSPIAPGAGISARLTKRPGRLPPGGRISPPTGRFPG